VTWYAGTGLIAILAFCQVAILPGAHLWGVRPDLVVLAVLAWAIHRGAERTLAWAVVAGVLLDLLSALPFGSAIAGLSVSTFVAGSLGPWLRSFRSNLPIILMPLGTAAYYLTVTFLLAATGNPSSLEGTVVALPAILIVNSVAALPLYFFARYALWRGRTVVWQSS
jgi:rod shape-determining protein MreD